MIRSTTGLKIVVVIVAAALFLAFSRLSFSLLVPGAIGIALVLFGVIIGYRPAAVLGLFVDLAVAGLSTEINSLVSFDVWQTSILGLLLPTTLLAWSALLAEDTEGSVIHLRTRAFSMALAVAVLFATAVPLSVASMSIFLPGVANTLSTMAEISLLFVVIAVIALLATWSKTDQDSADAHKTT